MVSADLGWPQLRWWLCLAPRIPPPLAGSPGPGLLGWRRQGKQAQCTSSRKPLLILRLLTSRWLQEVTDERPGGSEGPAQLCGVVCLGREPGLVPGALPPHPSTLPFPSPSLGWPRPVRRTELPGQHCGSEGAHSDTWALQGKGPLWPSWAQLSPGRGRRMETVGNLPRAPLRAGGLRTLLPRPPAGQPECLLRWRRQVQTCTWDSRPQDGKPPP